MSNSNATILMYKYRLYPTSAQERQMMLVLDICRHWYNMCIAEREWAWKLEKRSVSCAHQQRTSVLYRKAFPQSQAVCAQTMQSVCRDVERAFDAFFRRVKSGKKAGYPRYKGSARFNSFEFKQFGNGVKIDGRRLKLFGIGRVAVRWHRPIEGAIKTVRVVRKAGNWYACFACDVESTTPLPNTGKTVGIDVGIASMLTTSSGEKVANPAFYRAGQLRLRHLQKRLARAKRGSRNRQKALLAVQRQQEHVAGQRRDFLHKLSTDLVRRYDGVALEELRVKNMVKNRHLSKSILDSGWSMFRQYLSYKAANAGRKIATVNPAYTSKACSNCGAMFQDFSLSTRWVSCSCGLSLDRDHNAAINILKKSGWDASVKHNVAPLSPPPLGGGKRKRVSEATRH